MENMYVSEDWRRLQFIQQNVFCLNGTLGFPTPDQMADFLEVSDKRLFHRIEKGESKIPEELAEAIHRHLPSCPVKWLLTGEGEAPRTPIFDLLKTVNPFWPNEMLSVKPLAAPVTGRWGLHDVLILEMGRWVSRYNPAGMPVRFWEFQANKRVVQSFGGGRKDTLPYEFDPRTGYLTIDRKPMLVTHLTGCQLVIRDWSEMTEGTVLQYFFTRM